jgi:predicted RNase H-like HicB family nuclease
MKMDIYGFKANVYKDGKWLVGEIPELHVHDQAKTLRDLENELKDAVDTVITFVLENGQCKVMLRSQTLQSLFVRA